MTTAETTRVAWHLEGKGYEFCNCDFGCGCNFGGFPNSSDGSCRALVANRITRGRCGDVDLSGVTCAAILSWPKAIHEGNGTAVFVVEPEISQAQIDALGRIFSGSLGGLPWELLGPTLTVAGLVKARIVVEGEGRKQTLRVEGVGEALGDTFKNPVTGEDHLANVDLPHGFIWKHGECGQGSFRAESHGVAVGAEKSNWIYFDFAWSNA